MTNKIDIDLRDIRLDLSVLDKIFDKWYTEEENLSGVLNMKVIKQRNNDLRLKIDAWKKKVDDRRRL